MVHFLYHFIPSHQITHIHSKSPCFLQLRPRPRCNVHCFLQVLACPLELIVKWSAMRSFLVAVLLAVYYQYLLTIKNYTSYLLSDGVRHAAWASSSTLAFLVNANKEGLFSCIGYLAIYFAFQAVCMRLMAIVESSRNADHSTMMSDCFNTCGTCVLNLLAMWVFFYVSLELARTRVQDVSRRLCNLSFICYIVRNYE